MRIVDLSHALWDGQPCFPGDPIPHMSSYHSITGSGYNTTLLAIGTHQGTHLDAPFHFLGTGQTVDAIPLARLYGPATLIDLAPGSELDRKSAIEPGVLEPHAAAFEPGARILYRTGWGRRFGSGEFFSRYPSLTVDAACWIADRKIGLLGMDTPSPSEDFAEVHRILLGAGIIIVESLGGLDELPREFLFIGFPLKLQGRDGSPIRAAAVVDDAT